MDPVDMLAWQGCKQEGEAKRSMVSTVELSTWEIVVQSISALATAAAAVFAALSARSAAASAREMERARDLTTAPVLTITPNARATGWHFDCSNAMDWSYPGKAHFRLENHGNGPALNLSLHYRLELTEPPLTDEVLVVEVKGMRPNQCYASNDGFRWDDRPGQQGATEADEFITSLAKAESEDLVIPAELMRRWALDAVSYQAASPKCRAHVSQLEITISHDTMLRTAVRRTYRFRLQADKFPALGAIVEPFSGGVTYACTVEPIPV